MDSGYLNSVNIVLEGGACELVKHGALLLLLKFFFEGAFFNLLQTVYSGQPYKLF